MAGKKKELQVSGRVGQQMTTAIESEDDATTELLKTREELIQSILSGHVAGKIEVSLDGTMKILAKDGQGAVMTMSGYVNRHSGYREAGITALPGKMSPSLRKAEAERLSEQGFTQTEIAERLGVSQKTISRDLE